jgi:hypothetical protein
MEKEIRMKRITLTLAAISMALTPTLAMADDPVFVPSTDVTQKVNFLRGIPTVTRDVEGHGAVQITPLPVDHGSMSFLVVYYNGEATPTNFGVENIRATVGGENLQIFTERDMEHKAKNRAAWTAFGMAILGAVATAAQSSNSYSNTYVNTPHGGYSFHTYYHDSGLNGAQAATIGATGAALYLNEANLRNTIDNLSQNYLQTTTIDPNNGFGGKVAIHKLNGKQQGLPIVLTVTVNGVDYPITFSINK